MTERIYLDYNAGAPLRAQARQACLDAMAAPRNASSVHSYGREARKIIEEARAKIAALTSAPANQVIFGSGATEANNTVLAHFSRQRVLVSAIEHPSVIEAATGAIQIPVTSEGLVDLNRIEDVLKESPQTALVSVMLVNNETGAVQPVARVSALAKQHGALVHCDAVQAAGRIPVDIQALGIDFLTLSSHKIGGPAGAGALVLGLCGATPVLLHGGGQEKGARAGTENAAAIAGFGVAADTAKKDIGAYQNLAALRDRLEKELMALSPEIVIHAARGPRVAGTSMFSLPGADSQTLLMALDLEGIAVSNGSACSSGRVEPSRVLKAMSTSDAIAAGALRVSMGWATTERDIDRFLEVWPKIYGRMKNKTKTKTHA